MFNESLGSIDISLCAQVVSNVYSKEFMPLVCTLAFFALIAIVFIIFYSYEYTENKLLRDYLRRRNGLNDFETWKKDRKINN